MDGLAVLHHLEFLVGDIDEDVIVAEIVIHPAAALEIELDLPDAVGDRHIHHLKRRLGDDAVLGEAMASLEPLHRSTRASS